MSEINSLYQQLILDHNARPRNFGELKGATHRADGHNPLCGDSISLFLDVHRDTIEDLRFVGSGCAISTASTSLMTAALKGKTVAEARRLFDSFRRLVTGDAITATERAELGKLTALEGVREFPIRIKCATLAWHALHAALACNGASVSTE